MPPAELARAAGLRFDWQARRYQQQARNYSMGQLINLHERLVEADRAMKSGASADVVMPTLVTAIAALRSSSAAARPTARVPACSRCR